MTDAVMAEVAAWQARPVQPIYPLVFFDALRVKIRGRAMACNKAIYLALGILPAATRDILGPWIEDPEGSKFWIKVFNDVKTRRGRHPVRRHRRLEAYGRGAQRGISVHHEIPQAFGGRSQSRRSPTSASV